ncbi:hypothetical protein Tco_1211566 [Tanacetum coccineum]
MNVFSFYRMETDEISEQYIAPCIVNGLEAYDGEVNLAFDENLISNEFGVKLCLDYEVKKGKKLVKKELNVALKGELYFVKFIINPKEDDFEPGVILGRSFLRLAKGVIDFGNRVITIYPKPDPIKDDYEETVISLDDWDQLLDFNIDDVPKFGEELPPFVELDGKTVKEDEEAVKRIKGEALKEKDDPNAFIFPIRLEGKVNKNALADIITAESDSDDEEEYVIKRNKFRALTYGPKPAPYLNCTNLEDHLSAIQTKPDHKGCYTNEEEETGQWRTEIRLTDPYGNIYLQEIDDMLRIRVREAESDEEIFTSVAWIRAFNINEPIYAELCHEFYSTYEFDEVCADDELQSKKIIKFRLGGRAHRGLCNDDNFNAQDYWLSISREDNLSLSRSHTSTIRNPILRMIHKMITYGLCQRTTSLGDCEMDEEEKRWDLERESNLLWDLDTITLRDLIDSEGKLILEDPQPGVPRVGIPRPPRASMQDLYDRMGRMEICQDAIERMEYRHSYHRDRYHVVFEHMAGVYSVPLQ